MLSSGCHVLADRVCLKRWVLNPASDFQSNNLVDKPLQPGNVKRSKGIKAMWRFAILKRYDTSLGLQGLRSGRLHSVCAAITAQTVTLCAHSTLRVHTRWIKVIFSKSVITVEDREATCFVWVTALIVTRLELRVLSVQLKWHPKHKSFRLSCDFGMKSSHNNDVLPLWWPHNGHCHQIGP